MFYFHRHTFTYDRETPSGIRKSFLTHEEPGRGWVVEVVRVDPAGGKSYYKGVVFRQYDPKSDPSDENGYLSIISEMMDRYSEDSEEEDEDEDLRTDSEEEDSEEEDSEEEDAYEEDDFEEWFYNEWFSEWELDSEEEDEVAQRTDSEAEDSEEEPEEDSC